MHIHMHTSHVHVLHMHMHTSHVAARPWNLPRDGRDIPGTVFHFPPPALQKFCILAPTRGRAARSPCEAAPWSASTARPPALEHVLSGVARTVGLHAADQLPGLRARHVAPLGSCRMQVDSSATR